MTESSSRSDPPHGPIEQRIMSLWHQAWDALSRGETYAFFISQAETELLWWKNRILENDVNAQADLSNAEALNRSHAQSLATHVSEVEQFRKQIGAVCDQLAEQNTKLGFYAFQHLGFANGAVALGTLGYLAKDGETPTQNLVWVVALSAAGFLLNILSAYIASLKIPKLIKLYTELTLPWLSETDRAEKINEIPALSKEVQRWPRLISYTSAGLLIVAVMVGTATLSKWQVSWPVKNTALTNSP